MHVEADLSSHEGGEHKHLHVTADKTVTTTRVTQPNPHIVNLSLTIPPNSVHRKRLPEPPAIQFSSERGKIIFSRALLKGTMNCYFAVAEQFTTQSEPTFCGLSSLVLILNSLSIDPFRVWKGPWRWFVEDMLHCCDSLESIRKNGIVFDRLVCLARCNGAEVLAHHATPKPKNLLLFREHVERVCKGTDERIIVSYSRKAFDQTGDGHFSPIGGYDADEDLVLIMDVARFKYPPHWVPLTLLWTAMQAVDSDSGKARGWLVLSAISEEQKMPPICYTIAGGHDLAFAEMDRFMSQHVPLPASLQRRRASSLTASGEETWVYGVPAMIKAFFESLPPASCQIITLGDKAIETPLTKEIRAQLRQHHAFELIKKELPTYSCCADVCLWHPELATILLLVISSRHIWDLWPEEDHQSLSDFCAVDKLPKALRVEVARIQLQLQRMQSVCC